MVNRATLLERRKAVGLKRSDVGRALGVHHSTIAAAETPGASISDEMLARVVAVIERAEVERGLRSPATVEERLNAIEDRLAGVESALSEVQNGARTDGAASEVARLAAIVESLETSMFELLGRRAPSQPERQPGGLQGLRSARPKRQPAPPR